MRMYEILVPREVLGYQFAPYSKQSPWQWCDANIKPVHEPGVRAWYWNTDKKTENYIFSFLRESDAIRFALRWS